MSLSSFEEIDRVDPRSGNEPVEEWSSHQSEELEGTRIVMERASCGHPVFACKVQSLFAWLSWRFCHDAVTSPSFKGLMSATVVRESVVWKLLSQQTIALCPSMEASVLRMCHSKACLERESLWSRSQVMREDFKGEG